jgi:electron transfer flavoprotein alpha subunit
MSGVLAILEQRDGAVKKVSHEVLGAARTVAGSGEVHALLIGPASVNASGLGTASADKVFVAADDGLKHYQGGRYAAIAADLARAGSYSTIVGISGRGSRRGSDARTSRMSLR